MTNKNKRLKYLVKGLRDLSEGTCAPGGVFVAAADTVDLNVENPNAYPIYRYIFNFHFSV